MKKLFLASYFAFVSDLLLPLLPKNPRELRLAFIPTAANLYPIKPLWFLGDKMKLKLMGFQIVEVDIQNKTKEEIEKELVNIDVIFVCGGNTYYLLEWVQKSGFDEVVKELISKGVVYVGSSAGSALACKTIEYIEDLDDKSKATLTSYEGLGLTNTLIVPHYGDPKIQVKITKLMSKWKDTIYKLILLTNNQALIGEGENERIVSK